MTTTPASACCATIEPLKVKPLPIGKSADLKERRPGAGRRASAAAHGIAPAYVVSRREFAGSWEYLIDRAIFTAPAHSDWSGAALIYREGKLVGVGSLIVGDAAGQGDDTARQHVRADRPAAADHGRPDLRRPRLRPGPPWLGLNAEEVRGRIFVSRVTARRSRRTGGHQSRRHHRRVQRRAAALAADFYRKVWALGSAGASVPLDLLQTDGVKRRIDVKSMNRLDYLRLKSTF